MLFGSIGNFTSTKGYVFTKATENFDRCTAKSISSSKRENQFGWPIVDYRDDNGKLYNMGGSTNSFQAWMDSAADNIYKGLCIDGWLYVAEGI